MELVVLKNLPTKNIQRPVLQVSPPKPSSHSSAEHKFLQQIDKVEYFPAVPMKLKYIIVNSEDEDIRKL